MAQRTPEELKAELGRLFGFADFRGGQRPAVEAVLGGRDVVLVMPTGSGKSLCFQFPALLMPGVTLVVSPLIALMKDQVDALERRGIAATFLNSSVDGQEMVCRMQEMCAGHYKLVYVAPERFRNQRFMEYLATVPVSMITIDEAHCISQWGHDFRPDYLQLRQVVDRFPEARVMAVTATATPEVRQDIIRQLGLGIAPRAKPMVSVTGFARHNLHLAVSRTATHDAKLRRVMLLRETYGSGIVYCATRKMTDRVHELLREEGIEPILYHGALGDAERARALEQFIAAPQPLMVATNAFGMGVDRPDIRFVVHWDVPGSIEAYYQEVGRAGRDGRFSWCELLFNFADVRTQQFFIDGANPSGADILALWNTVRQACAKEAVTCSAEEWAEQANLKNSMAVRGGLGVLERAGLVSRETLPGNRKQTTRLLADGKPENLRKQFEKLEAKRESDQRKLQTMLRFVDHRGCRHAFLLDYFGEVDATPACVCCDICRPGAPRAAETLDDARLLAVKKILSCVGRMTGRFDAGRVVQVLRGQGDDFSAQHGLDQLTTFGLLADWPAERIRAVLEALLLDGCVATAPGDAARRVGLTARGLDVVFDRLTELALSWPPESGRHAAPAPLKRASSPAAPALRASPPPASRTAKSATGVDTPPLDGELHARLAKWNKDHPLTIGEKQFHVLQKKTLEELARHKPRTIAELEKIYGLGDHKIARYGMQLVALINEES